MPHARPEQGVLKTQVAVTLFRNEIVFNRDDARANLFITLAAADADSHLAMLVKISELLQDESTAEKIFASKTVDELYRCFAD